MHDAYMGINENPKRVIVGLSALAGINALIVIFQLVHGEPFLVNGEIAAYAMNLLCAILLFTITGVYLLHQRRAKEEEE